MLRRWTRRLLLMAGCLCLALGVAYGSLIGYLAWREQVSPSTQQVLVLQDGRQIPLVQPSAEPVAPAEQRVEPQHKAPTQPRTLAVVASTAEPPAQPLPPLRITIPRIDVDWPVVLGDNDNLPRFKGVGWFMGSGWPGVPGNMVLFGHLGGQYGTFMRLHELQPGDEFSVFTAEREFRFRVKSSHETAPNDVAVMAPTTDSTVTLITCSGPWDPVAQTNVRRLIVSADLIHE